MNKIKKSIVALILITVVMSFMTSVCAVAQDVKVPIILYHNIAENTGKEYYDPYLNIPADLFEMHIRTLKEAGYNAITYEQYYNYVINDEPLPENPVIITFDDGYSSNYIYAYPILKKYNTKATIFVITDRRGMSLSKNPHFSWNQAREMADSGIIDIQSHTHSHQAATTLSDFDLVFELKTSKRMIENKLGRKCSVLAFPFGDAGEREIEAAKKAGYLVVNKVGDWGYNAKSDGLDALKRITVRADWSAPRLLEIIEENMNL